MNFLDKVVGFMSPEAGVRRVAARKRLEILSEARNYTGASQGRRMSGWNVTATSADAELSTAGNRLRDRARDLVRNNPHAARAITIFADNMVGEGIIPRANTGNPATDLKINEQWAIFANGSDPEGLLTFYGQQYQAVRLMVEAGEGLMRKAHRKVAPDMIEFQSGLQVQLMEADFLDTAKKGTASRPIVAGVEYKKGGIRNGYWLMERHHGAPSDSGGSSNTSKFWSSTEVAHYYEPQRTQSRGASWFAPVMKDLKDLDDYESAELLRKKIEACMVGVVSASPDDDPNADISLTGEDTIGGITDANGQVQERFEPGTWVYTKAGRTVTFNTPAVTAGYEANVRAALRKIAAGLRVPYELLTNDLSQVNYSSSRVGILEFRRFIRSIQRHLFIPMFCMPVWNWFVEDLKLRGVIGEDEIVPVVWTPPKFEQINPVDDTNAEIAEVRAGFRSWDDVVSSRGENPDALAQEIALRNAKNDALGLVLDTDPRQVTQQGMFQLETTSTDGDDAAKPGDGDKAGAKKPAAAAGKKPSPKPATKPPAGKGASNGK